MISAAFTKVLTHASPTFGRTMPAVDYQGAINWVIAKAKEDYVLFGLVVYILMQPLVRFLNQGMACSL